LLAGAGCDETANTTDGALTDAARRDAPTADAAFDLAAPLDRSAPLDRAPPPDLASLPDLAGGKLIEHIVAPAATDPDIDNWLDDHYAYLDTRVVTRPELVVFLAGAGGTPKGTVAMLKEIAG
jgi:hypothetical protein